ncbi:hypothetical protein [Flavobacterium litorale]|uniref:YiaAB two helix domain-containing protein n=1 Tax=Flavobacterium litorale TaxID=2856519 RepID=A0ABX8VFL7_9FLAO|nr:hypothetical protein [Flavobacterium litorale]QYJ69401.1 hypothetical protein K1I41_05800 [Flavobacterium litorale]
MPRNSIKSNRSLLIAALLWLMLGLGLTFVEAESLPYQAVLGSGFLFSGYAVMTANRNIAADEETNKKKSTAWI